MRVFVQSLDGKAHKWFRGFPTRSIDMIDAFLKHRGDKNGFILHHRVWIP
jgi:hypothetical protein